ncbi:hypothetical protein QJS04_geneDACA014298 [Acorus gramineus]|uniref:Uncharacterized protein n=1 Tax=Acorus gramineus TaxID=55184 RepID=A0AAV9BTS9_ACOGR|nr:hypothetical protein QJS04_geneDACA014298 [Acorus gramineus]
MLELIDNLQHLGIGYLFDKEINESLSNISSKRDDVLSKKDLHATSLLFRLLRDHGFQVKQDVFDDFTDRSGEFVDSLCDNTKGLLSLYEASYHGFEGESTIDKGRAFSTEQLKEYMKGNEKMNLREQVDHALELPRLWRMQRLEALWFIDQYERQGDINIVLLNLAKLDFNMVQSVHQESLRSLSRWWADLGLGEKLSYMRDRLPEHFLWGVGTTSAPQYRLSREGVTKVCCLITAIDDTYDVYGSIDELVLFTDAIERWDLMNAMEKLPDYMKILFLVIFNTTNEMAYEIMKDKGVDVTLHFRRGWTDFCKAHLVEAKWYHSAYKPTLDEYLNNAFISISGPVLLCFFYFWVAEEITQEAMECLKEENLFRSLWIAFRLADDLGTSSDELKRGDVPKAIQCYMNENEVSEEVSREHIRSLLSEKWKNINEDRVAPSPFPREVVDAAIDLLRIAQCIYQYGDGHGSPDKETKDQIMSLFIQPISLDA